LIPAVISLVEVDDAFVRNEAVRLLGTRGDEAMPALARAIDGQDPDVRKFALDAISTIDSGLKNDIYRRLLLDKDVNLVITVVEHIGREGKIALKANVEVALEEARHPMLISACVDALGQLGDVGSLNAIYRKLGGDEVKEFQAPGLIRAIGNLGGNEQIELLSRILVRFPGTLADTGLDAIEALSRRALMPVATPELLTAIRSIVSQCKDPMARYKAVHALGAFNNDQTRGWIAEYLSSNDKIERLAAVESMANSDISTANLLKQRQLVETDGDVLSAIRDAINQQSRIAA
jgi:HEAT repeat protein